MEKMLYFDYSALIIIIILVISTIFRNLFRGRINRYFFAVIIVAFISVVADIFAVTLDNMGAGNIALKYIFHSIYLIAHGYSPAIYLMYLIALTDTWHIVGKNKLIATCLYLPYLLVIAVTISNIFTHKLFYFDEMGGYTRGPQFITLYIVAAFYCIVGMFFLLYYCRLFSKSRFSSLITIYPLIAFSTIFQMINPEILIEMFAHAIGILYIFMMIQRPEESINVDTQLRNIASYVDNIKQATITKKKCRIIMINITNYHAIKVMLGYETTVKLLREIADKLQMLNNTMVLNSDLYYIGSGKFRVVASNKYADKLIDAAKKINKAMKHNMLADQMEVNLTTCVCITNFPEDVDNYEDLIALGNILNARFYNGHVVYATDVLESSQYKIMKDIDSIIEYSLANHKFEVYYQPIYSVKSKCFKSAEALLRLHTDDGGFIPPDIFITAAEKNGTIYKIGTFVLEEVCKFITSSEFEELHLDYIEVNLSVAQCMQKDMSEEIIEMIKKYDINPAKLNLEITETAASYSQNTLMNNLNELAESGIEISLDDFGTGYSNMMRIASLPLSMVKLDKAFADSVEDCRKQVVLNNTIRMIKELNMQIVVEGVETAALAKKFAELNCEYIQGYYYSKPIPKDKLIEFIASKQA